MNLYRKPRVLVACEYSGIVRDAFAARGWDAWSCDLLDTERPGGNHFQGDIRDILYDGWDLVIAHPPCTYLSNSGVRWLYDSFGQLNEQRWRDMEEAAAFFNIFLECGAPHIAVENPIMHGHGVARVGGKATQFVQPYHFGTPESKRTGLRLINLPKLEKTNDVTALFKSLPKSETHKVHYASPGPDRWKERSRTYPAIAQAMADQWGPLIEDEILAEELAILESAPV